MLNMPKTKRKDLKGIVVGSLESRKKTEMTRLIENLHGDPVVAPSMREVSIDGNQAVKEFGEKLFSDGVDVLVLSTGVGTRKLIDLLSKNHKKSDVLSRLKKVVLVARGPKPVRVLSEEGLTPNIRVPEPNTWREMLKTLDKEISLQGKWTAVQEYGESNKIFLNELVERGADVFRVPVYRAEMPEDMGPLKDLIQKIFSGKVKVLLFTNATQVAHFMRVVSEQGKAEEMRRTLRQVAVGSVGPSATEMLKSYGLPVDFEPERPMMGALVAKAAEKAADLLKKKEKQKIEVGRVPSGLAKPGDVLHDSLLLKACRREKTERTPVWLMRQAGRYMKEYRELRSRVSFLELCKTSDLASEVTVDAAHRLNVDAAIIFSDILIPVEPLGFQLSYEKNEGPVIGNPFRSKDDLNRIRTVDPLDSLRFTFDAIRKTRSALKSDIPLIGFVGAPYTLASYLIEGGTSRTFVKTKSLMLKDPKAWHAFLEKITQCLIDYANEQIHSGAQVIQIFDSWAGSLRPEDYRAYAFPYTKELTQSLVPGVPVINFATQSSGFMKDMKLTGGDVIGVDWRIELDEAWKELGDVAVMGNLDPVALFSSQEEIRRRVQRILNQAAGRPGHIFNLGHGILPETPLENVIYLIKTVKELSAKK